MERGKILNNFNYKYTNHYFNKLHKNSNYIPPNTIGCDINYNKFKKHGIELRIFDYFPEEYLEDIINFIILLCHHSTTKYIDNPINDSDWQELVINVLKNGSQATIPYSLYYKMKSIFNLNNCLDCFSAIQVFFWFSINIRNYKNVW
jgi:hypothetical protein